MFVTMVQGNGSLKSVSIRNTKRKNNDTDTILNSSYLDDVIENPYITCHEVYNFKKKYNITEPIILKLVGKYLGLVNNEWSNDLKSFWGARYLGNSENDQELDLTFENNQEEIVFGLSIKSSFVMAPTEPPSVPNTDDSTLPKK
jgi:hypothetical protein